ncbi:hypothetical protein ABB37_08937 [Leptomonas pyrrhocoris]|uniref:Uncharacterized protein n=1 Tax=Leptomonas pyrrhocoris TaxID=157538 RepID=A0A0M9FS68_LEPPY|nr:hypothetical protein ABB37_08937 [Leptomonas pyrrhocoris]XP_015653413.1 hypothetical protein ABB37_08937 [Leptomonas pyrrhocoris]XP_015653414.1 hypothetical protein ABB37_08937 [Leptomonas pyrrhocoris]KPA74973.1 hypothetical protein ABB37_08937 [Leptomonas pyrrhocoris]KPA74974.1 hypothetical protein ABB37_08937 [Leptomonas pyrrhocoris]KPA74975.1 hypothetical protein ABB37_08937 [Leptomonas pyrrhocoris]|eukprot:XP_015653412.1 hypothetical protein ABB37_08937 [Leptomonas pyrrhocoris]
MQSAHGSSSKREGLPSGGVTQWAGAPAFNNSEPRFLPSASEGLLRTPAADSRTATAAAASAATRTASTRKAGAAVPIGGLALPSAVDLIERSAFLYGLLHSDRLVYDVHDAIATLTAAAGGTVAGEDINADERRRACGRVSGGSVLSGVFYFPSQAPWPEMPWRPTYKSAVLLCVFVSVAACRRAIARLSEVAMPVRGGTGVKVVQVPLLTPSSSSSCCAPSRVFSPSMVLRPASEYTFSPESVDTALLTFLTAPQLAELLLRRRRMQAPLERGVTDNTSSSRNDRVEDMLAYVRANPPSSRLSSSAARLYAALLSPQSTYSVDWAAAQVAVNRGDGTVVPEMAVVEPWVGGGGGLEDRNEALREQDRRGGGGGPTSEAAGSGRGGVDGGRPSDPQLPWDARTGASNDFLPVTLQEEDYRKRYGVTPQGRLSGGGGGGGSGSGDRRDSSERLAGMMPSRSSVYLGARQLLRGASWILCRLRDGLMEEEAPLLTGASGTSSSSSSSAAAAAAGLAALPIPPALPRNAPYSTSPSFTGATTLQSERGRGEPPRQRYRTEDGDTRARQVGTAMVIPRYNAVGTALSWMPGFQHIGRLFVTSTTVLTPEGAAAPRVVDGTQRSSRRRRREEQEVASADNGDANPAWESLVMQRYADAAAERTRTSQALPPVAPASSSSLHDSVLSWMSPARGPGWTTSSWPSAEMLQSKPAVEGGVVAAAPPHGAQAAALARTSARTAEVPLPRATARRSSSGLDSLSASAIVANVSSSSSYAHQAEGNAMRLPTTASTVPSSFDGTGGDRSALSHASSSRRGGCIKVEGVHASAPRLRNDVADDDASFLAHHRRRHGSAQARREGVSTATPSDGLATDATWHAATAGAHARPSLAEGLRTFTREAREIEVASSAAHTPLGAAQRVKGAVDPSVKAPAAAADLAARSSRRTVSFALPNETSHN